MVEVDEASPEVPPQDVNEYFRYQPIVDPESEFPWHHPDQSHIQAVSIQQTIDMSEIYNPWEIYRGHIPPSEDNITGHDFEIERKEDHEEMRRYAWEYQAQVNTAPSHVHKSQDQQHYECNHHDSYQSEHYTYQEHHWQHNQHTHNSESAHSHHEQSNVNREPLCYQENSNKNHSHNFDHNHTHDSVDHHHEHKHDHMQYDQTQHTHHDSHNDRSNQSQHDYHLHDSSSHTHNSHHLQDCKQYDAEVYHAHIDHSATSNHRRRSQDLIDVGKNIEEMNGDISDTNSEVHEDIRPRHPYDGYYLKHRVTIDSHGRKICTHEILPSPSPSPPESPLPVDSIQEEIDQTVPIRDNEDQSGVAGNLARVVPGATGSQREALDDLTRRQGWEAGNIDYMGADSFDNIWAKISQTLSQPRVSPAKQSPPKETTSPQEQPQHAAQPTEVSQETVEVAKEALAVESSKPKAAAVPVVVKESVETPAAAIVKVVTSADIPVTVVPEALAETPVSEKISAEIPVPEVAATPAKTPETTKTPPPVIPTEVPKSVEAITESITVVSPKVPEEAPKPIEKKTESPVVSQPPPKVTKETSDSSTAKMPKAVKTAEEIPVSPDSVGKTPASSTVLKQATTPEKAPGEPEVAALSDSPPLANTPSKEEAPAVPAAKSEQRRKPAGKLQLSPPAAADPLPTPDSELEDAAALAQSIIASELRTPTVTAPEPAAPVTPASPPSLAQEKRLSVEEPEVPTPPIGAVSLAQIGVKATAKGKSTTAAQIESSVSEKPESAPAETPKKKVVRKVVKKESASGGEAPVPPPRKKEKKPKDK